MIRIRNTAILFVCLILTSLFVTESASSEPETAAAAIPPAEEEQKRRMTRTVRLEKLTLFFLLLFVCTVFFVLRMRSRPQMFS